MLILHKRVFVTAHTVRKMPVCHWDWCNYELRAQAFWEYEGWHTRVHSLPNRLSPNSRQRLISSSPIPFLRALSIVYPVKFIAISKQLIPSKWSEVLEESCKQTEPSRLRARALIVHETQSCGPSPRGVLRAGDTIPWNVTARRSISCNLFTCVFKEDARNT